MRRNRQAGLTSVEFAIVGGLLMMVVFGVIEFGRALYTMNLLTEGARRGARLAAVCPVGDPKPASAAVFATAGGSSTFIPGLTTANALVEYLDTNGNPIPNAAANFGTIRYVRVSIVSFSLPLMIPFIMPVTQLSGFSSTLPRESLGVPRAGAVQAC